MISDIMKMITTGTSNDVKIVLEDGEIHANKDVLSARCAYFATCFSSKFIEGETNVVTFSHCSKMIMEKIIKYLFCGEMKLHDLLLADLLKMMNMTKMMMLDDLLEDVQDFCAKYIEDSGVNLGTLPELVNGLILAEQFKLEIAKDALVLELFRSLKDIPHTPDVVLNSEAFKNLPVNLVKDIFLRDVCGGVIPSTKERLDAFVFWLTENECSYDDKRRITESFNFDAYTVEELLTDVRSSGLYSVEKIDRRVLEIHQALMDLTLIKGKTLTSLIARKDSLLSSRDEKIRKMRKEIKKLSKIIEEYD